MTQKTYNFSFYGRQSGAIGIFYKITEQYIANSLPEAAAMLYTDYEHIKLYEAKENTKEITKEQFNAAVCQNFKTDYKGKGVARK